jgi:23S rRNA pseudouridine2457 synthase
MTVLPRRYFALNKPIGILSQFTSDSPKAKLLGSLDYSFPEGTHAIGRLDKDSEGLLLLTTDKRITGLLFDSEKKHLRTYLVMVEGLVSPETLQQLKTGVTIEIRKSVYHKAIPVSISVVKEAQGFYPFAEDERCQQPHTWLLISLTEGKYRQIRKMVGIVKHPCIRLIRLSIEQMTLEDINPGEVKEFSGKEFLRLLCL